jgi:hypothetical protein
MRKHKRKSEHSERSAEIHREFQSAWDEFGDDASTEFLIAPMSWKT